MKIWSLICVFWICMSFFSAKCYVLSLSGLIKCAVQQVSLCPECFIKLPQKEDFWFCSKAQRLSLVVILSSAAHSSCDGMTCFRLQWQQKGAYMWNCNKVVSLFWGIIEYYRWVLSWQPSCYNIHLTLYQWRSIRGFKPQLLQWLVHRTQRTQLAELTKGATQYSLWQFLIIFSLHTATFRLKCWHFQFRSTYARWGYNGVLPWEFWAWSGLL